MIYENLKQKQRKNFKKGGGAENMNENKNDVAYVIFYSRILFLSKTSLNSFRYPNIPQILHFTSQCCVLPPSLHSKINGFFLFQYKKYLLIIHECTCISGLFAVHGFYHQYQQSYRCPLTTFASCF